MDVSSANSCSAIGLTVQKKAQDVQAQQVLKVLESTAQHSRYSRYSKQNKLLLKKQV